MAIQTNYESKNKDVSNNNLNYDLNRRSNNNDKYANLMSNDRNSQKTGNN